MSSHPSNKATLQKIRSALAGLKSGGVASGIEKTDDPEVNSIIDEVNNLVQAQAQAHMDASVIIDALGIGIWKWDLITNLLEWDENMYRLYGARPTDFSGAYDAWEKSLSSDTKAKAVEEINLAVAGKIDFDTTFQVVQKKTGKIQEIRTRAFVIRDESGKPLKMWGINIDRTREAKLEAELKVEQAKLVQSSKLASLGEMSAGIAHEINNPLAIISGSVELLSNFVNNPEKLAQKIESIQKAIGRIAKIVGGLKKFSRSSEKNNHSNCLLSEIVQEALVLTDAKSKRNDTLVRCDYGFDGLIFCDQVEIEQVLVNLLSNSIDAVKDLELKWVKVEILDDAQSVVLRVIDSGSGIPGNVLSKIFDPFFTTKSTGEGTGLGLSITKGILDEHKATITVLADCPNTCFEIRFLKAAAMKNAS